MSDDFLIFSTKYCKYLQPVLTKITEEERWVHLRISFRHLLMNLKDNYLLKKTVQAEDQLKKQEF